MDYRIRIIPISPESKDRRCGSSRTPRKITSISSSSSPHHFPFSCPHRHENNLNIDSETHSVAIEYSFVLLRLKSIAWHPYFVAYFRQHRSRCLQAPTVRNSNRNQKSAIFNREHCRRKSYLRKQDSHSHTLCSNIPLTAFQTIRVGEWNILGLWAD